jgi:response regulator RpfG family c-di-GMP phosphodiesterase
MPGIQGTELLKEIRDFNSDIEVIIITGCGTLKSATEAIRYGISDYILKPFDVAEMRSAIKKSIKKKSLNKRQKELIGELEKLLLEEKRDLEDIFSSEKREAVVLINLIKETLKYSISRYQRDDIYYIEFIKVLANTLEGQDRYTRGHSDRVNYYSNLIAQKLLFTSHEIEELQISAFLHDIGKLGITRDILVKEEELTETERIILRQHPEKGVDLISPLRVSPNIIAAVRNHHESLDGSGYPDHLKGEEIPLLARIIAVADAVDAMRSERPYRRPLTLDEIKREFKMASDIQFDPMLIDIILQILEEDRSLIQ